MVLTFTFIVYSIKVVCIEDPQGLQRLSFEYVLSAFFSSVFLKHLYDTLYEKDTIK